MLENNKQTMTKGSDEKQCQCEQDNNAIYANFTHTNLGLWISYNVTRWQRCEQL